MPTNIRITEITALDDPLLLSWLDLYEMSFPPEEKVLISQHLRVLHQKSVGGDQDTHLLTAVDEHGALAGLMRYRFYRELSMGYLWYLAVDPEIRNSGVGSFCYKAAADMVKSDGADFMFFEVEEPELMETVETRNLARRRIGFYRRNGARMLTGIDNWAQAAPHQPFIRMHIMVHPFVEMSARDVFERLQSLLGDSISKVGELGLE